MVQSLKTLQLLPRDCFCAAMKWRLPCEGCYFYSVDQPFAILRAYTSSERSDFASAQMSTILA
jgi:hypothetical protein